MVWDPKLPIGNAHIGTTESPFYGCTLSALADLLVPVGMVLVDVHGIQALFVHHSVAPLFQPIPSTITAAFQVGFVLTDLPQCLAHDKRVIQRDFIDLRNKIMQAHSKGARSAALNELHSALAALAPAADQGHTVQFTLTGHGPAEQVLSSYLACPV